MLQRLALLVFLAFTPALARGQLVINETNDQDSYINIAECSSVPDGLTFRWTVSSFVQAGSYELWYSDTSGCPIPDKNNGSTAITKSLSGQIPATSATGSFPLSGSTNVKPLLSDLNITCNSSSQNMFFCVDYTAAGTTQKGIVQASLRLDLLNPAIPNIISADGTESALVVSWSEGTSAGVDAGTAGSTNGYRVFWVPVDGSEGERTQDFTITGAGTLSGRVSPATNGKLYNVQVAALSPGSNVSDRSGTVQGTPEPVNDFWRTYRNAGGREQGGCATGAAGLAALVLLVPLAFRRSRRRP